MHPSSLQLLPASSPITKITHFLDSIPLTNWARHIALFFFTGHENALFVMGDKNEDHKTRELLQSATIANVGLNRISEWIDITPICLCPHVKLALPPTRAQG